MKAKFSCVIFAVIIAITSMFVGCRISSEFLKEKELGKYPMPKDFPNTEWVCREIDMHFYMLDYGIEYIIGEFANGSKTLHFVGSFGLHSDLDFEFYSESTVSESADTTKNNSEFLPDAIGHLYTEYVYENDVIVCTILSAEGLDIKETVLTFENKKTIAKKIDESWMCVELNMRIHSFDDINGYYKGEMVIDDKKCNILAYKVANNYYRFYIENGKINNLTSGVYSLIEMNLQHKDGKLVANISEYDLSDKISFPYWNYEQTILTFNKINSV